MDRRIKVAQVIVSLNDGGAARVGIGIATGLDPARFESHLICHFRVEPTEYVRDVLEPSGVTVHTLDKRFGIDPALFLRLRRTLRAIAPDIVHSHGRLLHYVVPLTARNRRVKHVHTMHSIAGAESSALMRRFYRTALNRWVTPVGISRVAAHSLEEFYGLRDVPMIYNGIDVERFRSSRMARGAWRERHGFGTDDILVTCVANLRPEKQQSALIDAAARLMPDRPGLHLVLVGHGPLLGDLDARARGLGIRDRVHILGERGDVPEILNASDVFAMASLYEGHPLAIMEAMAAGCAVVATQAGGTPEVIDDGTDGILVPVRDTDALASALARLIDDTALRVRLGGNASGRARARFGIARMTNAYAALYRDLVSNA